MTIDEFCKRHPTLYHVAHASALPQLQRHGLLSTQAIINLLDLPREQRTALTTERRPEQVPLHHPVHGTFYLRDQKPLHAKALANCLDGITPSEWLQLLNARVFLWPGRARADKLLHAREYRGQPQLLLQLDARPLLTRHADQTAVTRINTGSVIRKAARRGRESFIPLQNFPATPKMEIAEVAILNSIPNLRDYIRSATVIGVESVNAAHTGT